MEILIKYFTDFTNEQLLQFDALKDLYIEWNEKINVISRKDMNNFYEHHVLHSLSIATQFGFPDGYAIMDLGSGGGFPGIPLAIFFPNVKFYLVDSINKKLKVANEIINALGLKNIVTLHTRAEDIRNIKFDIIVSRAVAPLIELYRWSKPLLKNSNTKSKNPSGLICLKGGNLKNEIAESGLHPNVWEIEKIFHEPFFMEKYILYINIQN